MWIVWNKISKKQLEICIGTDSQKEEMLESVGEVGDKERKCNKLNM